MNMVASPTDAILVSPAQAQALMEAGPCVAIDTRGPDAFAAGHLPGAVNLHNVFTYLATSDAEGMAALTRTFADAFGAAGLGGDETAIVYEESMNTGFGQSCRGYFLLSYLGYKKVVVLHGGFQAWSAAGLPVSTAPAAPQPRVFPVDPAAAAIMVDSQAVLRAIQDKSAVLLDVRDVDEWIGESSSPYGKDFCPRKGRLPGARWIEWYRMMKPGAEGPMFKSPDEIRAELATVGIGADTPLILYCFKGARASNTLLALKQAGVKTVRMYFGSWNEWSRDPSLPIETGLPA